MGARIVCGEVGVGFMRALSFFGLSLVLALWAQGAPAVVGHVNPKLDTTELSGYVSTAYQWHLGNRPGVGVDRLAGNSRSDRFALDVVSLTLQRKLEDWPLDFGYAVQLWLGPDGAALATDSTGGTSDFAIKQAYIAIKLPVADQFSLKLGVFDTFIGYEAVDRPLNAHYTHSWGWALEPTQHTGLMAQYKWLVFPGDTLLDVKALVADSRDARINAVGNNRNADDRRFWGVSATLAAPELLDLSERAALSWLARKQASLSVTYMNGFDKDNDDNIANNTARSERQNFYVGAGFRPWTKLSVGATLDVLKEGGPGNDTTVMGLHLGYDLTDRLSLALRTERLQDGTGLDLGTASDAWDVTSTLRYRLVENVITRMEYRWTRLDTPGAMKSNTHALLFNVIYQF